MRSYLKRFFYIFMALAVIFTGTGVVSLLELRVLAETEVGGEEPYFGEFPSGQGVDNTGESSGETTQGESNTSESTGDTTEETITETTATISAEPSDESETQTEAKTEPDTTISTTAEETQPTLGDTIIPAIPNNAPMRSMAPTLSQEALPRLLTENDVDISFQITHFYDANIVYLSWLNRDPDALNVSDEWTLTSGVQIRFLLDWAIKDSVTVNPGDYFTFIFPNIFDHSKIPEITDEPLYHSENPTVLMATYSVTSIGSEKVLTVTFANSVTDYPHNINGSFRFNYYILDFEGGTSIDFHFNFGSKTYSFPNTYVSIGPKPDKTYTVHTDAKHSLTARLEQGIEAPDGKGYYYFFWWSIQLNFGFDTIDNYYINDTLQGSHRMITPTIAQELGINISDTLTSIDVGDRKAFGLTVREYTGADNAEPDDRFTLFNGHLSGTVATPIWEGWNNETNYYIPGQGNLQAIDGRNGIDLNGLTITNNGFSGSLGRVTRPVSIGYWTITSVPFSDTAFYDEDTASTIKNSVNLNGSSTQKSTLVKVYTDNEANIAGIGTLSFSFKKIDIDNQSGLKDATFALYSDFNCTEIKKVVSSDNNGTVTFVKLKEGTYYIKEIEAPQGYILSDTIYKVVINNDGSFAITDTTYSGDNSLLSGNSPNNYTIANKKINMPKIAIKKVDAEDNVITSSRATFVLTRAEGGTQPTISYDDSEELYVSTELQAGTYTLTETRAPTGYIGIDGDVATFTVSSTGVIAVANSADGVSHDDDTGTFTFTVPNEPEPEKISISAEKIWVDGNENRPDSITVNLYKVKDGEDNEPVGDPSEIELSEENQWKHTWTGLPKYDEDDSIINYTVEETGISEDDYRTVYSGSIEDGFTITNTLLTDISVEKIWVDGGATNRPTITVTLYDESNTSIGSIELSEENQWKHTWTGLPKYDEDDNIINYTVEETGISEDDYSTDYGGGIEDGFTITNTLLTDISATKIWVDGDENRPSSITMNLYANGTLVGNDNRSITYNEDNTWTYTWENLPTHNSNGEITYTVEEEIDTSESENKYQTDYSEDGFTITNTLLTDISVEKVWLGGDAANRPTITVTLYDESNTSIGSIELSEENQWKHTWTDLPKYDKNGKEIKYTVTESSITDYNMESSVYADGKWTITNKYTPGETNFTAIKTWDDNKDQDGLRPSSIRVQLFADGDSYGDPVELNSGNSWQTIWNNLPLTDDNAKVIVYSVEEITQVQGYTTTYNGSTITNTHVPATVSNTVRKVWVDDNNRANVRPTSITVQLLADGDAYESSVTLDSGSNWQYTWRNLPEKANGVNIVYTVQEINISSAYTASYNQATLTITNTYTPDTTTTTTSTSTTTSTTTTPTTPTTPPTTTTSSSSSSSSTTTTTTSSSSSSSSTTTTTTSTTTATTATTTTDTTSTTSTTDTTATTDTTVTTDTTAATESSETSSETTVITETQTTLTSETMSITSGTQPLETQLMIEPFIAATFTVPGLPDGYSFVEIEDGIFELLDDNGVPLGYIILPEGVSFDDIRYEDIADMLIPYADITIPEVLKVPAPAAAGNFPVPKTGNMIVGGVLMMMSLSLIIFLIASRKRSTAKRGSK